MPWVDVILDDLNVVWQTISCVAHLGNPFVFADAWFAFIRDSSSAWLSLIPMIFSMTSICDRSSGNGSVATLAGEVCFSCTLCPAKFGNSKALSAHMRSLHKIRCLQRLYAPGNGRCLVCSTTFSTRLRLIAHLSDTRVGRNKCWRQIISQPSQFTALDELELAALDNIDRVNRREAARVFGPRSHPRSTAPALSSDGRLIGGKVNVSKGPMF